MIQNVGERGRGNHQALPDVLALIKRRRSIGRMTSQQPDRLHIERMIEAGLYAPNHHNTEPWRFFVIAGYARNELGQIMERTLMQRLEETTSEQAQTMLQKERNKPLRAPVIIVVVSKYVPGDKIQDVEDFAATAAAVQNMLLVAEEMGLACIWRTGHAAYDPQVKGWLGLAEEDHIVALIDVGFPALSRPEHPVRSIADKTTWVE